MLCVSTAKSAGRGAEHGVDNVAVIQSDKWGAAEAFANPWSGGTRPIRIEAKRHGSHTSVGGLRAGPGVDRVAAIIQGDVRRTAERRCCFSSRTAMRGDADGAAETASRRHPARFLGFKTKI